MAKFSEQFDQQLVPEWKEAYVDYRKLKKHLKKIRDHHNLSTETTNSATSRTQNPSSVAQVLLYYLKKLYLFFFSFGIDDNKVDGFIQVHKNRDSSTKKDDLYETEVIDHFNDMKDTKEFFSRLDIQLNKVNQFYKKKEEEFMQRGESLKQQLKILIKLKTAMEQHKVDGTEEFMK